MGFSARSIGILKGEIGAFNGWLVRTAGHGWIRDIINNPTTFILENVDMHN